MRTISIISLAGILFLLGCTDPSGPANEVTEVFDQSESKIRSYDWKSYDRDIIDALFEEEMENNAELTTLVESVQTQLKTINKFQLNLEKYTVNKTDFYGSTENHLIRITDSANHQCTESEFAKLLEWEANRMEDQRAHLLALLSEKRAIEEQLESLKIRTGLSIMKRHMKSGLVSNGEISDLISSSKVTQDLLSNWKCE